MSVAKRGWRRSPISPLAHSIRMDAVRHANVYPSCRLDKKNRAVYEPEDVWAKRAALAKPDTRPTVSSSKARVMFKQKVMAISTTGVTKADMENVDLVKETVAVLMKSKERATDIGKAERCILRPHLARKMARMSTAKRTDFEKQVEQTVEQIVYAAKRRYVRRQEKLDEAGVFHPEANAHSRVHTQFWADLNNRINITKIENDVWAKMSAAAVHSEGAMTKSSSKPTSPILRRAPSTAAAGLGNRTTAANDADSARPSSKDSYRHDLGGASQGVAAVGDGDEATNGTISPDVDETLFSVTPSDRFAGILGYDELGHVPTLDEFRSEWPKMMPRSATATPNGTGEDRGRGVGANGDEVFRHFKKYYDKADHNGGRAGDALFSAGVTTTGLLQPDFGVIETVGRHTAEAQESRSQSRIGERALSVPGGGTGTGGRSGQNGRGRRRSREGSGSLGIDGYPSQETSEGGGSDGLTNVFRESMPGAKDSNRKSGQAFANPIRARLEEGGSRAAAGFRGDGAETSSASDRSRSPGSTSLPIRGNGLSGNRHTGSKEGTDSGCAKASLEGSSTSAELQARLETSWRALYVPARLKLDFLQKYCTLERVLDLPSMAHLLETASRAVPVREKVIDHLRRIEDDGEPMSAVSVFSSAEEDVLYDLECWETFIADPEKPLVSFPGKDGNEDEGGGAGDRGSRDGDDDHRESIANAGVEGDERADEKASRQALQQSRVEKEMRWKATEAVLVWLRTIESRLTKKCAEVCDAAWYNLGETITYKGRPVAYSIPETVMEDAAKRREDEEDRGMQRRC
ncbi:unnamed protein product [Scytosiphon promiscuus]